MSISAIQTISDLSCSKIFRSTPEFCSLKIITLALLIIVGLGALIASIIGIIFTIETGAYGYLTWTIIAGTLCAVIACIFGLAIGKCYRASTPASITAQEIPASITAQETIEDGTDANKDISYLSFNSWCMSPKYYEHAKKIIDAPPNKIADAISAIIIQEQRYLRRKDVIKFNLKREILNLPTNGESISFGVTPVLVIGKREDGRAINTLEAIKDYLRDCLKNMQDKGIFIPKIFIPTATAPGPGGPIPHAVLLVIEPALNDPQQANITVINPLGRGGGYKEFEDELAAMGSSLFPSSKTKIVHNHVHQQQDGWACGWHMLENIELLSKISNVQKFILENALPIRSSAEIQKIYDEVYRKYARDALS